MSQPSLYDLAKQGDTSAIATLLARSLFRRGIKVAARQRQQCLEIAFKASQLPHHREIVQTILHNLPPLETLPFDRIRAIGWQTNHRDPLWIEDMPVVFLTQQQAGRSEDKRRHPLNDSPSNQHDGLSVRSRQGRDSLAASLTTKPSSATPIPIAWPRTLKPNNRPSSNRSEQLRGQLTNFQFATVFPRTKTFPSPPCKHPWLAVNLSMIWPGLGQLYSGAWFQGCLFSLGQVGLIITALWALLAAAGNTVAGIILLIASVAVWAISLFDAYRSAKRFQQFKNISEPSRRKDPWFAVFLSQVLPGLGQLYNENIFAGALFIAVAVLLGNFSVLLPALIVAPPLLSAAACYHAYVATPIRRPRSQTWLLAIVAAIAAIRLTVSSSPTLIHHQVERFIVPSESMLPTLQVDDRILVHQSAHYLPELGDIVVFQPTQSAQKLSNHQTTAVNATQQESFYVKRIIGQPGQKIRISGNQVYVNDQPLQESYIQQPPAYEWGPKVVPPDSYLVLGDNRNRSADSHLWGFLPRNNIVGKAYKIYWPPNRIQPL